MIITREVQKRLEDFQPDYVFTYRDLNLPAEASGSIIKMLNLRRPIYKQTAAYGHFGRNDLDLPWEKLDKVDLLKKYLA